jgi:hypothetical protein
VPTVPEKVHVAALTTPKYGVRLVHRARVPDEGVTLKESAVDAAVTVFPELSSIVTTGCVSKAAPETPALGCVVKISCVAAPVILKLALVADVSPFDDAVSLRLLPSALP